MCFVLEQPFVNGLVKRFDNHFKRYHTISFFSLQYVGNKSFSKEISGNPFWTIKGKQFSHENYLSWTEYPDFSQDKLSCIHARKSNIFSQIAMLNKTSKFDWKFDNIRIEKIISVRIWACQVLIWATKRFFFFEILALLGGTHCPKLVFCAIW